MGMYTECAIYAKHSDGSSLTMKERDDLLRYLESEGIFDYDTVDQEDEFVCSYTSTSLHEQDELSNALERHAMFHEDSIFKAVLDFDGGSGVVMLFSGDDVEVLQKIVSYEEPKKIKWD